MARLGFDEALVAVKAVGVCATASGLNKLLPCGTAAVVC